MTSRSGPGAGIDDRTRTGRPLGGIELLGFDLDGTLVDSAPDLSDCLGNALESVGLPRSTEAQTRSWVGDGVDELIRRALANMGQSAQRERSAQSPPSERSGQSGQSAQSAQSCRSVEARNERADPTEAVDRLFTPAFAAFASCYERNLFVRITLYPAVADTLSRLAESGVKLCCITNKREHLAAALLEQADIHHYFDLVLGGDSLPEKKPSPMQLDTAAAKLEVAPAAAVFIGDSDPDFQAAKAAGWRFIWAAYGYRRAIKGADESLAVIRAFTELPALLTGLSALRTGST